MSVITRFAPSPTGFLHIGGARTALFNWLYTRHNKGKFLLRIEDTDKKRSTQVAIDAIIKGLDWLGLGHDDAIVFQSKNIIRHQEIVKRLLAEDKAYYCYCSQDELEKKRSLALSSGKNPVYDRKCRDLVKNKIPKDVKPVVRLKNPIVGETKICDLVQGEVSVQNEKLDDLILLRASGTPTYMLSVVIDDYDMQITDIIRGDDHLTNTFRQKKIYEALGWQMPKVCHIPLIHGSDGAKLSKRHGALGIEAYKQMGILPEALCNYLLRLGWSHKNDEIIPRAKAIEWFNLKSIGKSPSRFDQDKLLNVNAHYLRNKDNQELFYLLENSLEEFLQRKITVTEKKNIILGLDGLKIRAKSILELAEQSKIYLNLESLVIDDKAKSFISGDNSQVLVKISKFLENIENHYWTEELIEKSLRNLSEDLDLKLGKLAQPLRVTLTGKTVSPSIFEIMNIIGKSDTLARINRVIHA